MTTECLDQVRFEARQNTLRDAVFGVAVAVIFVIPATLTALVLL